MLALLSNRTLLAPLTGSSLAPSFFHSAPCFPGRSTLEHTRHRDRAAHGATAANLSRHNSLGELFDLGRLTASTGLRVMDVPDQITIATECNAWPAREPGETVLLTGKSGIIGAGNGSVGTCATFGGCGKHA